MIQTHFHQHTKKIPMANYYTNTTNKLQKKWKQNERGEQEIIGKDEEIRLEVIG